MQKVCSKCSENKSIEEFYKRRSGSMAGKYYDRCKDCFKIRGRNYYYANRERQLELIKIRTKRYIGEKLRFLAEVKNKPCVDCGKFYPPWVMDFDHRDPSLKEGHVSFMLRRGMWGIDKARQEIEKCDIVCANCHRHRTYKNGNGVYLTVINKAKQDGYKFFWKE